MNAYVKLYCKKSMLTVMARLQFTLLSNYKIKYEKMELLKPKRYSHLKSVLQNRLSREILVIEIETVNFHEQYANLKVTFAGDDFEVK